MRKEVPVAEITSIGPRGENLPAFLNLLKETNPVSYDNYNKTVKQILPLRPDVNISKNPKNGLLGLNFIENDISYSSNLVSEGTLRVLGLIAALRPENKSTLIGYEEPENGIHPVRIKQMAEMLKNTSKLHGKQLIITTHSPLFTQMFAEEANRENTSVLVCQRIGRESSLKPLEAFGPLYVESQLEVALSDMMLRGDFGG